jgi:hypothetical protein
MLDRLFETRFFRYVSRAGASGGLTDLHRDTLVFIGTNKEQSAIAAGAPLRKDHMTSFLHINGEWVASVPPKVRCFTPFGASRRNCRERSTGKPKF